MKNEAVPTTPPAREMVTVALPTVHVTAMVAAMEAVGTFEIEKTAETVVATFPKKNGTKLEVFRALKKGAADVWIIRHHAKLFA